MLHSHQIQWFKTSLQVQTPENDKIWSNVQLRLARPFSLLGCKSETKKGLMRLEAIQ
jgi:hypothetical protein